jgi:membrane-associated phospholipid phosphatase
LLLQNFFAENTGMFLLDRYCSYAVATGTGILRMYNNKHWLGDVAAGAGIGILSTTLSYWLYDKIHIGKNAKHQAFFFPGYSNKQFTIGFVNNFNYC